MTEAQAADLAAWRNLGSGAHARSQIPHIVVIGSHLYGYGHDRSAAWLAFHHQISGASQPTKAIMLSRAVTWPISDELASEVAEMLCAPAIRWEQRK